MTKYITHLRDVLGNNYLGISIEEGEVYPFLNEFKDIIGDDEYDKFTQNRENRDGDKYHITIINVMDYNRLSKEMGMNKFVSSLDKVFKYEIDDLKLMGLGTAERNSNSAYFVVCRSEKLESIRNRYGLSEIDFHITLGFNHKDIFGIRKNILLKYNGSFLKLLSQEFYKNNNWNFIRRIENFDFNDKVEIIPISNTETTFKFKCDGYYFDIVSLDGKLWKATKYLNEIDLPRMSETEISKVLNK